MGRLMKVCARCGFTSALELPHICTPDPMKHAEKRRRITTYTSDTTQHIKSLVADYIFKIYGEVPSDKLWDELWEKVKDKETK